MPIEITAPRISADENPREILATHFASIGELPIHGGWGYSIEDAVVIDKGDPVVRDAGTFNGVELEYIFVEKRIYEELIILRLPHDRYSGIRWDIVRQVTFKSEGRNYDVLDVEVTAFPENVWEALKTEWESSKGATSDSFDFEDHLKRREAGMVRYKTEYHFDITSFFGT